MGARRGRSSGDDAADEGAAPAQSGSLVNDEQLNALRERLSAEIRSALGAAAVPKRWLIAAQMPMLVTGKPDRAEVRRLLEGVSG